MLYFDFKNYEEFKEIFGIVEHGNGTKSRKNLILLSLYKDREQLREHIMRKALLDVTDRLDRIEWRLSMMRDRKLVKKNQAKLIRTRICLYNQIGRIDKSCEYYDLIQFSSLIPLKRCLYEILGDASELAGRCHRLSLMGRRFFSDSFETDDMEGLCEDGTLNAIRYRNIEKDRVFKMKAGKMFNHIMSCNRFVNTMPVQIKRWLSEQFVADWIEYARDNIGETEYTLHVDDDFEGIYSSDRYIEGNFGSCMVDDDQWTFYKDAVTAKAAYLTDCNDNIVARCIVFTEVFEVGSEKVWRLAERQYSKDRDLSLQRQLVSALIRGGFIDGYKKIGASCHAAREFVDNEGNSLEKKRFYIKCHLECGDTLSYQDSFKYYDEDDYIADNYGSGEELLNTTDSEYNGTEEDSHEDDNWSDYHGCYLEQFESCYVETRGDYFYNHECRDARVWNRTLHSFDDDVCFEEDVVEINGTYYYAGTCCEDIRENNIMKCPVCGDYMVYDEEYNYDTYYSELTDEDYCCSSCLEEAEITYHKENGHVFSEYDDAWFEDAEDVISVKQVLCTVCNGFVSRRYINSTISVESFNVLVEACAATEYCGVYYIDDILYDGEPKNLGCADSAAA